MLEKGTKLNETYRLMEEIGSGGGGIVYKAYHERLKIYVVAKQMREKVKGILEERAEADILKNIKHTYLPRVYDFLEIQGEIYTVMDFIPGTSLAEALKKEGRFSQKEVLKWAGQLAQALSYLHNQKPPVIHSDIKPSNIMLTPERDICLIDFNISLAFDRGMRTSTGTSEGYSPPEQYRSMDAFTGGSNAAPGRSRAEEETAALPTETASACREEAAAPAAGNLRESSAVQTRTTESLIGGIVGRGVDERSDIYSLGATLYHLLTGIKPPRDFEKIIPADRCGVGLSQGLALIINKMMDLDPGKRYQNGGELLYALEHIYELDAEYRSCKRRERSRKAGLAFLYAAGAAMAASGWLMMQRETRTAYNRAVEAAGELLAQSRFEEAQEKIQQALSMVPGRVEAYEKEILRLYTLGSYREAVNYGRDVLNNPPFTIENKAEEGLLGDIYYIVGNSYFELEDYGNALSFFKEALNHSRSNSGYFSDYAVALAKTGNTDQAEAALSEALALGLGQDFVYMVQGEIAFAKGDNSAALNHLLLSIHTTKDENLFRRAALLCSQVYERMGEGYLDARIALLEEAEGTLKLESSMHITEELAEAYVRKAREKEVFSREYYGRALKRFRSLYEQGYSSRQTMENIAIICQQMEELDQAEDMLNQMAERYPEDYRAYKRLAFLEADRQQQKANGDRDYGRMKIYAEKAGALYEKAETGNDTEMDMLENMMRDLRDGGWL